MRSNDPEESKMVETHKKGQPLSAAGRAYLQRNQRALELARQAALKPACNFKTGWDQPPNNILFPEYADMRRLARLLRYRAIDAAQRGDSAGALRDVNTIFRMTDHLSNQPVLIGFLVSAAMDAIGHRTLADVLQTAKLSAAQAQTWQVAQPRIDWNKAFLRSMQGERTFMLWAFTATPELLRDSWGWGGEESTSTLRFLFKPLYYLWMPVLKIDQLYSLRLWKQHIAGLQPMQVPAPQDHAQKLDQQVIDAPPYAILTRMLFPVFSRTRHHRDRIEVFERQQIIALALAVYRTQHGRYPATLQEAAKAWGKPLPLDVFGDKPFRYRSDGRTFTLYSIGDNRQDDKGRGRLGFDPEHKMDDDGDDIAWVPMLL
jgi:hypothetical protein